MSTPSSNEGGRWGWGRDLGDGVVVIAGPYLYFQCWGASSAQMLIHSEQKMRDTKITLYLCLFFFLFFDFNSLVSAKQSCQTILPFMSAKSPET